jgi:hypothetical protein
MTEITTATRVDALPAGLGPNVVLTEPRDLPPNLEDVAAWARSAFFAAEKPRRPREPRGRHRATKGYQYLTNLKVARFVDKNFEARPTGWLPTAARLRLPKVSHYVPGAHELLLMEPIDPSHEWEKQAQHVATRFSAYENAIRKDAVADHVRMLAYLLPGGPMRDRDEARERIAPVASVIDTARRPDVERFVEEIVRVAQPVSFRVTP